METNGLGKLIPKAISQRRKKKQSITGDADAEDSPRGRSAVSREATADSDAANAPVVEDEEQSDRES